MKKIIVLLYLFAFTATGSYAQLGDPNHGLVKWISLEKAMEMSQKVQKPILLDFYTDWCGWCKHMMKTTYSEPELADYINNYFYPVQFNAEGKDTITWLGKEYKPTFNGPKSPHEFAIALLGGSLSYPTTVFLNGFDVNKQEFALNMRAAGFLDRQKIEPMLIFTVEAVFRNCNFDDFSAQFTSAFYDSTASEKADKFKWITPTAAFNTPHSDKKKTIVFLNTEWCNTCRVMKRTSFPDSKIMAYIDTTFRVVNFNPELRDSLTYLGQRYGNAGTPQSPFHDLARVLTRGNFVIPSMVILDEDDKVIDSVPFYLTPELMNKILHFYGDNTYKLKSWQDYSKEVQ